MNVCFTMSKHKSHEVELPVMNERFANTNDIYQVKALLSACELPVDDITPGHMQHFITFWKETELAGVVGLEMLGQYALLRSLAVASDFRGLGIGTQLTTRIEEYALANQVKKLYLLTTTAEGFFAGLGYQAVDREALPEQVKTTTEFRTLCPDTAVGMTKSLSF